MELTQATITKLLTADATSTKISIYIPTHPKSTSQTMNEDRIRFKNALKAIETDYALAEGDIRTVLNSLIALADNTDFWRHQAVSLAIFADENGYQAVQLPHEVVAYSHVGTEFVVSPLLALGSMSAPYFVLNVNLDAPRLYGGTDYGLTAIGAETVPGSIDDVLDIEQRKKSLDFRSGDAKGNNMFYGHGSAADGKSNDIDKYLRIVAAAVDELLAGNTNQLLLAGTVERIADIRALLAYGNVAAEELHINRDLSTELELHRAARRVISAQSATRRAEVVETYKSADSERTVDGITAVTAAAEHGKVDTLYLPVIRMTTDGIDESGSAAALVEFPEDMDGFEAATRAVHAQGGTILAVEQHEFSDDPSMKALLRF